MPVKFFSLGTSNQNPMKKKLILFFILFASCFQVSRADEGMWLLYLLGDKVYQDMVKRGLKLSKEQLYSLNKASLKDAIIIFGGGCTGEIVSNEGLIFTNHHCGYGAIAGASTVEKNYLRDGFWAKSKAEEISAPGLSVQFLVRIDDVTKEVLDALGPLTGADRQAKLQTMLPELAKKKTDGSGYEGRVVPMFAGNQFLLFVYERFNDVRLVGTPPESIGKFGGDTDNWEWPRHTGDFSVFRVYANAQGKPAAYAAENVPLKPKHFLPVSTKGFRDGDFAMIFGYPGSTQRYETSYGVKLKTDIDNPTLVSLRDVRLKLMFEQMKKDPATKLKLASTYASIANYWKFFDGESKQLLKFKTYEEKQTAEQKFIAWAKGNAEYETIFARYEKNYADWRPYAKHRMFINEGIMGSPLTAMASSLQGLERAITRKGSTPDEVSKVLANAARIRKLALEDNASDQQILAAVTHMFYQQVDPAQHPTEYFNWIKQQYGDLNQLSTYQKLSADVFSKSLLIDDARWNAFEAKPDSATLQNDPAYKHAMAFVRNYQPKYSSQYQLFSSTNSELSRLYLKGLMAMEPNKLCYPDANFTMRLSHGQIKSYKPRDAVFYDYVCTLSGVMQKYKPGDYEFDLPQNLIDAYNKKDFGAYADPVYKDIVVGFITTNDITGGNSGSPVINAKGELLGLAFDGNYEALSHKIAFDKDLNRTICVDVRYVLWCIEKLGGATNIIKELSLK
jgi:hypothetical protein